MTAAADKLIEVDTIFGRIFAFADDVITDHLLKFGAHTRPELAFLLSVVRPGDFVFDLGGHIGTFAIPLAQKIGAAGRLHAVEGWPANFALLNKNIAGMRLAAGTETLNALIASSGRRYEARTPLGNTGGTVFLPVDTAAGITIETVTIDALCDRYFTPRIVKLDIEGGEFSALAGAKLLQREHPIVYAEVNGPLLRQQGASAKGLEGLFRDNGYRLFRNIGDRNVAHDNFVVAELRVFPEGDRNFDVMAVHRADERLDILVNAAAGRQLPRLRPLSSNA